MSHYGGADLTDRELVDRAKRMCKAMDAVIAGGLTVDRPPSVTMNADSLLRLALLAEQTVDRNDAGSPA